MKTINLKISGIMLASFIIIVIFVHAINIQPAVVGDYDSDYIFPNNSYLDYHSYQMMNFDSYEELTRFLENCSSIRSVHYDGIELWADSPNIMMVGEETSGSTNSKTVTVDFSTTNIQVEGVDEPDFVKTDGEYLYIVVDPKVFIVKAWPAENAEVIGTILVDFAIKNIFINDYRLVIFGNSYNYYPIETNDNGENDISQSIPWFSSSDTIIQVYNIKDRAQPELKKDIVVAGNFFNARMIDDHVYVITTQYTYNIRPLYNENNTIVPMLLVDGQTKNIPLEDFCCIDVPSSTLSFTHVVSFNIKNDDEEVIDKIFTLGNSQTMYVSKNNIYITYQTNYNNYYTWEKIIDEVIIPVLPEKIKSDIECAKGFKIEDYNKRQILEWLVESYLNDLDQEQKTEIEREIAKRIQNTVIHKISVNNGKIDYICNGSIPGRILNQFSMDEHNGYFRVATQIDNNWRYNIKKSTNVYILDENLDLISKVENIAPGENMHSARFMGNRAYLVTFKNIDPFFTLDLTDPYSPKILGELKIPGYSDYLHPYDENHVIGIGKESDETIDADRIHSDNAVYYTAILGVKIALFDVSDFANPKEVSKVVIGDRGTNTPVLNNHKAFLFDKEKELLVLPISLYEVNEEIKEQNPDNWRSMRGTFKLNGAYIYKLTLEEGFELKGIITHNEEDQQQNNPYYNQYPQILRSLYIDNSLYTISNNMVKINDLNDLSEIKSITLI